MQGPKIALSPAEAALIGNAEMILTKNSILQKTVALLAGLQQLLLEQEEAAAFPSSPKISRGENYLGLPYVVLDYPRISRGEDLLFIRTMFWWGNFFSSTLQVAGSFKHQNLSKLATSFDQPALQNYYLGINPDPWQHHFGPTNYKKIAGIRQDEFSFLLTSQPHIKIAARWPLSDWDAAANHLYKSWKTLAGLIA